MHKSHYCYLPRTKAKISHSFRCYFAIGDPKGEDSAAILGPLAVFSRHLTATSASAVRFCTPAERRPWAARVGHQTRPATGFGPCDDPGDPPPRGPAPGPTAD